MVETNQTRSEILESWEFDQEQNAEAENYTLGEPDHTKELSTLTEIN